MTTKIGKAALITSGKFFGVRVAVGISRLIIPLIIVACLYADARQVIAVVLQARPWVDVVAAAAGFAAAYLIASRRESS